MRLTFMVQPLMMVQPRTGAAHGSRRPASRGTAGDPPIQFLQGDHLCLQTEQLPYPLPPHSAFLSPPGRAAGVLAAAGKAAAAWLTLCFSQARPVA